MRRFLAPCAFGIVCILVLFASPKTGQAAAASDAASRYNQAGALYRDGKFREALDIYESLITAGVKNPDLFFNAANAAYRSDMIGKAVLYTERALRLDPSDRDALANLEFLNSKKLDKDPSPGNAVTAFLERRYRQINVNSAASWSAAAFALMMIAGMGALFAVGWKRNTILAAAGVCGMTFILSTGMLVTKVRSAANTVEAVIMKPEVNAFSGPDDENTHIFTVHEGTKATVERTQGGWALIRLGSGVGGWVMSDGFERI